MKKRTYTEIIPVAKPSNARFADLDGRNFNRLTVVAYAGSVNRHAYWYCQCICGGKTIVGGSSLIQGATQSCGCLNREAILKNVPRFRTTHRIEYNAYVGAQGRCTNPANPVYHHYGERGIEFRFTSFQEFIDHIGRKPTPKHSLDRIDNDGHYEVGNVRWATKSEQMTNRRSRRDITINGITKSQTEWANAYNISDGLIDRRRRGGWCDECSATLPPYTLCPHKEYPITMLNKKRYTLPAVT